LHRSYAVGEGSLYDSKVPSDHPSDGSVPNKPDAGASSSRKFYDEALKLKSGEDLHGRSRHDDVVDGSAGSLRSIEGENLWRMWIVEV